MNKENSDSQLEMDGSVGSGLLRYIYEYVWQKFFFQQRYLCLCVDFEICIQALIGFAH